jgi:hypothetical protein
MTAESPRPPGEVTSYYAALAEESRLCRPESVPSILGASAHLLGTGWKR